MSRRWWWPWGDHPTGEEAAAELARLEQRECEVQALGAELRERQQQNGFSAMVATAIARGAEGRP